ncbi:MAG: redoxin domain-containing protein [Flavobacteriales bacterium]|nr:redoxin domain-containing protein [Flavobacteriales bacterium]
MLARTSEGGGMVPRTHDFTLPTAQNGMPYTLSANPGKIRAFMFGSITNPPARMQVEQWQRLAKKYAGKDVQLFVIYGDELHPGDHKEFKAYPKPKSEYEKLAYAQEFAQLSSLPVLVDGLNNATYDAYGKAPNGAYLVDADGSLVFRGTWADARKMEHMIDTLLKWYKAGKPKGICRSRSGFHRRREDHPQISQMGPLTSGLFLLRTLRSLRSPAST